MTLYGIAGKERVNQDLVIFTKHLPFLVKQESAYSKWINEKVEEFQSIIEISFLHIFLSIVLFHETVTFSLCSYLFALSILECVTLSHKIRLELLISFLKGRKETFCMKSNKSVSLLLNFVLNQTFISFQFFHWLVPITDINFTSPGNVWL